MRYSCNMQRYRCASCFTKEIERLVYLTGPCKGDCAFFIYSSPLEHTVDKHLNVVWYTSPCINKQYYPSKCTCVNNEVGTLSLFLKTYSTYSNVS